MDQGYRTKVVADLRRVADEMEAATAESEAVAVWAEYVRNAVAALCDVMQLVALLNMANA